MIDGAEEIIKLAYGIGYINILVSKNKAGDVPIKQLLNQFGIAPYFNEVIESEEKDIQDIKRLLMKYTANKAKSFLISDRTQTDIPIGNKLGFITVWVKNGKFAKDAPRTENEESLFTIYKLPEFKNILESVNK